VFVECLELSNEGPRILQDDAHPIIQMRRHLVTFAHRHLAAGKGKLATTKKKKLKQKVHKIVKLKNERERF